jgi:hypothetical protein
MLNCPCCRHAYAEGLAVACATARQRPELTGRKLEFELEIEWVPVDFGDLAVELGGYDLRDDDGDVVEQCYRYHLVRIVLEVP